MSKNNYLLPTIPLHPKFYTKMNRCFAPCLPILLFFISAISLAQGNLSDLLEQNTDGSLLEGVTASGNHSILLSAFRAADLEQILNEEGPFTVFAPSDGAFNKLSADKIKQLLLPENKSELFSLLTYHIVAGNLTASKILQALCNGNGRTSFTTIQGNELIATISGIDIILTDAYGNSAKITTADSNQCNGVLHEIDSIISPNKI